MNAYRVTGKVAPDRTITVQLPDGFPTGVEVEIIVLFVGDDLNNSSPDVQEL